jgi:hypothetical protein
MVRSFLVRKTFMKPALYTYCARVINRIWDLETVNHVSSCDGQAGSERRSWIKTKRPYGRPKEILQTGRVHFVTEWEVYEELISEAELRRSWQA